MLALYLPLDLRLPEGHIAAAWRAAWILGALAAAFGQRPDRPRLALGMLRVGILCCAAGAVAVVAYAGGSEGARFGFLLAFPITGLVLFPEFPLEVALLGAVCFLGGLGLMVRDGRDGWFLFEWSLASLALTVLAVVASHAFRRVWSSELVAQRARAQALALLAESERQRADYERLATIGRLAAGVAHEINNPLSYVKSSLQGLQDASLSDDDRESISDARQGVERIAQIVADLRNLARAGPETPEDFTVEEVLEESLRLASTRCASVRATWSADPAVGRLHGNRRLLVQALVNLVANGADAAATAPDSSRRWVTAHAHPLGSGVIIHVDDGGPGLAPAVAERLFEVFVSTKGVKGTGLGLALAKEHVGRCGGTIEGGNLEGAGARFTIRLPVEGHVPKEAGSHAARSAVSTS